MRFTWAALNLPKRVVMNANGPHDQGGPLATQFLSYRTRR